MQHEPFHPNRDIKWYEESDGEKKKKKASPIPTPYYTKLPWLNLNIHPIVHLIASKFQPLFVWSAILLSSIFFQQINGIFLHILPETAGHGSLMKKKKGAWH